MPKRSSTLSGIRGVGHLMMHYDAAARAASESSQRSAPCLSSPCSQRTTVRDLYLNQGLRGELRQVRKHKDLVAAGRHCRTFFLNHSGWLFRYKILHNGDRQIVDFILPGQVFGLQACFFKASLYSIATITEASVSAIPLEAIDRVFEEDPWLAKALFWSAVCEAAIVGEHLIDAARRSACERVSHLMLELFVRLRTTGHTDGMSFNMPLTQELIGDALGLTTVHVNRTLRSLREDGLIKMSSRCVTILDFDTLSLLSDFDNSYLGETARALRTEIASAKQTLNPVALNAAVTAVPGGSTAAACNRGTRADCGSRDAVAKGVAPRGRPVGTS
jgi:CRP-like cAMP-binding protein